LTGDCRAFALGIEAELWMIFKRQMLASIAKRARGRSA
jgi:hypothetical protein